MIYSSLYAFEFFFFISSFFRSFGPQTHYIRSYLISYLMCTVENFIQILNSYLAFDVTIPYAVNIRMMLDDTERICVCFNLAKIKKKRKEIWISIWCSLS